MASNRRRGQVSGDEYGEDLALIHDEGFGDVAQRAADVLVARLHRNGVRSGLVTDLGCGSGIFAAAVGAAGFDVLGVDLSESMLALASARAPKATFRRASLFTVDIPPCVAVTAIGECLNYDFGSEASKDAAAAVFGRVALALPAQGVFLFDVAGPGRGGPDRTRETARVGPDWAVFARTTEDEAGTRLVRDITAFRRVVQAHQGDDQGHPGNDQAHRGYDQGYRRSTERHRMLLYRPEDIVCGLTTAGMRVEPLTGYGNVPFDPGLHGFLARRG